MDLFHNTLGAVLGSISNMIEGQLSKKITSDPYVSISVAGAVIGRTYVMSNSENPVWHQHFTFPLLIMPPRSILLSRTVMLWVLSL